MQIKTIVSIIFCVFFSFQLMARECSGLVIDSKTNIPIPYAVLMFVDLNTSLECDSVGFFRIDLKIPKNFMVIVSAFGYETKQFELGSEKCTELVISLEPSHLEFEEVVVSSFGNSLRNQTIANVESRSINELKLLPASTLGDMIANIPGVYQTSTGSGISKPVIRGLSRNRVITYLNGLRIENQQWGGDHGMGVSALGIGKVEVIKGPASLLYGSDALGGVLYLVDEPYADHATWEVRASSKFETVSKGTTSKMAFKSSGKGFRISIFGRHTSHADYQLPNKQFGLDTRYNEQNLKVLVGFNRKNWISNIRYNYLQNRLGIPGHTHEIEIHPEEFQVTDQDRSRTIPAQENQNHYILWENKIFLRESKLDVQLGQTINQLVEFEEKFTIPNLKMGLGSSTYNVRLNRPFKNQWKIKAGVQGMYQVNRNNEEAEVTLIPDAVTMDNGVYGLLGGKIREVNLEFGLRFDSRVIHAFSPGSGLKLFSKDFQSINFSAGFARFYKLLTIKGNVSSGFRAPHTSELLSDGFHHGALRYEVGNRNLKSEKAMQGDLLVEYKTEHINFSVNPFINCLKDYITLQSLDSTVENLPAYRYMQLSNAFLYGADAGFHYQPHFAQFVHIESSYSLVVGSSSNGTALLLMPQSRINSFLKFQFKGKRKIGLSSIVVQHQYMFEQKRIGLFETPSLAYQIVNAAVNLKIKMGAPISLSVGVRNLLNQNYIDHLSSLKNISMPHQGRNIFAELSINLKTKRK